MATRDEEHRKLIRAARGIFSDRTYPKDLLDLAERTIVKLSNALEWHLDIPHPVGKSEKDYVATLKRMAREYEGIAKECREVEQHLGKALHYPWYKDDQKNFLNTTEDDGVCIGEHTPGTIAAEARNRIWLLEREVDELRKQLNGGTNGDA